MSLPDGKLTLQGFSQLGDANSKKHAMVVRLSPETMEALEKLDSGAKIAIEFGEGPSKLCIGDKSFQMTNQPEPVPHELYLRMVQPNKPGAVLKLQGNVVGKLQVERNLTAQTEASVRDRTQQAEQQRLERKIALLDAPLAQPSRATIKKSTVKKVTKSTPAGHAPPPDPNRSVSASTSLQNSRVASPRISPRPPSAGGSDNNARYRLIHFVALKPRTHEDILRLVGGSSKESRKEVKDLIPEVLEEVSGNNSTQPTKYTLKTESWLEVRPFENSSLREDEVQNLIERGQEALKRLYVPESDPLWNNFRRDGGPSASASRPVRKSPLPPPPPKKAVPPKKKPAETTTKRKIADTIPMKDESVRPAKVDAAKAKEREETPTASAAAKSAARRVPGSGFRNKSQSSTPPSLDNGAAETHAPSKKAAVDRNIKREAASPIPGSSRAPSTMPPPPGKVVKREEPDTKKRVADDTREKKRPKTEPGEIELSPRKRAREIPESDISDRDSVASLSFKKKRRMDDSDRERPPAKAKAENRDVAAVKKQHRDASPLPARVKKEEREPTPLTRSPVPVPRSPALPPRPHLHERVPSVASNGSRDSRRDREDTAPRNGSAKPRRREIDYTSSEDDAPKSKQERKRGRSPGARREWDRERDRDAEPKKGGALPSDVRALRRLYDERIPEFVALRSKKKRLRDDMKRLNRRMLEEGADDATDDMPDDDECESLAVAEAAARAECVRIRDALYRITGQEVESPEEGLWSEDTD